MNCANGWLHVAFAGVLLFSTEGASGFEPAPGPERILITGKSTGSYLGVAAAEIDSDRAKALNLREERGIEVTRVEEEGPASKAGVKTGDVVLDYNGQRVEGLEQFIRLVQETPPGREVKLQISRAGALQTITVKTGSRKLLSSRSDVIELPRFEMPDIRTPDIPRPYLSWRSSVVGIEGEALDSQLAEFFGVKEGVLVRSVAKDSPAETAGIRAGDVLVRIDGQKVTTPREIAGAVRSSSTKKSIPVQIVREKREMSMNLAVDGLETPQAMPKRTR